MAAKLDGRCLRLLVEAICEPCRARAPFVAAPSETRRPAHELAANGNCINSPRV